MSLQRTPLYEEHLKLNAKMVPFAGWEMPIQYKGVIEEHQAVRQKAGIFDVGHMGFVKIENGSKLEALQNKILSRKIDDIPQGKIRYNRILNAQGGVVDDILVYKDFENYLAVFNAANVEKDIRHLADAGVEAGLLGLSIIAIQGPQAEEILQEHTREELEHIPYYGFGSSELADCDVIFSRTGYTGEKGFELMLNPEDCPKIWQLLVASGGVPCGLGARDTLRIEAGMPLYGHELKDEWTSQQSDQIVGLKFLEKGGIPRQGFLVLDQQGKSIGEITSGTFSPTLQEPIAMALIKNKKIGDEVFVQIRDKKIPAQLTALPFVNKLRKKSS